MVKRNLNSFRIFLLSNSLFYFSSGLFMPFYILFIQGFGNSIEQFGFAVGLMSLASAITSYFAGKYSDKLGRKPFLITGGFALTIMILAYTLITNIWQLYILQIITGIINSLIATMEVVFLGDLTNKISRGIKIGKYHAIVGIMASLAMMLGGFLVKASGYKIIFYITAFLTLISTLILFFIKEK